MSRGAESVSRRGRSGGFGEHCSPPAKPAGHAGPAVERSGGFGEHCSPPAKPAGHAGPAVERSGGFGEHCSPPAEPAVDSRSHSVPSEGRARGRARTPELHIRATRGETPHCAIMHAQSSRRSWRGPEFRSGRIARSDPPLPPPRRLRPGLDIRAKLTLARTRAGFSGTDFPSLNRHARRKSLHKELRIHVV